MKPQEVIQNIDEIYEEFETPQHLRYHMRLVRSVATHIGNYADADTDLISATCLLHDLGNVIKKYQGHIVNFPGNEGAVAIARLYGSHPCDATQGMLRSINVVESIIELVEAMEPRNWGNLLVSSNWSAKVCSYADMRVAPEGIVTLEQRRDEAARRSGRVIEEYYQLALDMQTQVLGRTPLSPSAIHQEAYIKIHMSS